jgi:hypothetical protein
VSTGISPGSSAVPDSAAPAVTLAAPAPRPITRSQRGIFQPKVITDGTIRYDKGRFAHFSATGEPANLQDA